MSTLLCRSCLLLSIVILWIAGIGAKEVRIVCYYTNWSVYRPGDAKFNPQNINPYLCTHLIYAFGGFTKENTLKPFDKYQDIEKGGYAKFVGLKTYNKNLKTMLAIGGWNEGSTRFSPMVANADRRKELIKNTIKFLRQNHFDGLDLDWEYPSFRDGGKSRDRDNYAQLVQELREEFERESEKTGRPRLLLTMAVPAGIEYINKGYDVPKLTKYLDWMNILSYDYHSAYEPVVNHHSPLYALEEETEYSYDIDLNIDYTINHYLKNGADKSKLVLGIPTYGRSYTLINPDATELGAPADGPGEMGDATRENGYLAYYEICESLKTGEWTVESPYPDEMGPFAYKDNQWVGYDDEDIARKKAEYVAENGLGGIMFWSIDNDDFRGKCGEKPYPIIEAAKEALLKAYGVSDASLLATTKKPIKNRSKTRGTTKTIEATTEASSSSVRLRQNTRRKNTNKVSSTNEDRTTIKRKPSIRRNKKPTTESVTVGSSLIVTPSYTTPAPPSTPDTGGDFKCEDEGFFPHPRDCKKYFWCLSGPSELGIVAHQFTCPAGLYFNKAASSCDYTQNVLCNKKLSKPTTTTSTTASTTTTSSTSSPVTAIFSTRRTPPKITAATSRTTFTTTLAPEEEEYEEYEDEDDAINEDNKDAEQDPRVIKELIDLIKKAGGIEELEKQLIVSDGTSSNVDSTTRSSINKSLYQKVLSRASATLRDTQVNKKSSGPIYNSIGRNSRGPQNEGLERNNKETARSNRGRPQYTSINRSRPSTEAPEEKDDDEEEEQDEEVVVEKEIKPRTSNKKTPPEYVTIRRQRISTTSETPQEDNQFKQLGEDDEDEDETPQNSRFKTSTTSSPYVTIRRSRPTTNAPEASEDAIEENQQIRRRPAAQTEEESPTDNPQYVSIRRQRPTGESSSTTPESRSDESTTSRYVELRSRGTTTPAGVDTTSDSATTIPKDVKEGSTTVPDDNDNSVEDNTVENAEENKPAVTEVYNKNNSLKDIVDNIKDIINVEKQFENETSSADKVELELKRPILSDPRPFSLNSRTRPTVSSTLTEESSTAANVKVSVTTPRNAFRNKFFQARNSLSSRTVNNQEVSSSDDSNTKDNNVLDDNETLAPEDKSDRNRFLRKRLRGEIETSSPVVTVDNSNDNENKDITEVKIRPRGRGQSRFTLQTVSTTVRSRPQIQRITETSYADEANLEYNRKYRPAELADLSSLTAADLKDFSGRSGFNSRRRQTTRSSTEPSTQLTEAPEADETLKTGPRTLPLVRKFLDGSQFGKSNRFRLSTTTTEKATTEKSEEASSSSPPKFRRPPPRGNNSTNSLAETLRAARLRRPNQNITVTLQETDSEEFSSTEVITTTTARVAPSRRRVILRKRVFQKPTNTTTTTATTSTTTSSSTTTTTSPTTSTKELDTSTELTTESIDDKTVSEDNTTLSIEEDKTEKVTSDDDFKSNEDDDDDEEENIKLSESNIRENSEIGSFQNGNVINGGLKPGKSLLKSFKAFEKELEIEEKPSTESGIALRTRKIIRKLGSTESPSSESEDADGHKIRKVIRRLKPSTASVNALDDSQKTVESSTVSLLNKGRKKFGLEKAAGEEESKNKRPQFTRRKFGSTTTSQPEDNEDEVEKEIDQEEQVVNKPSNRPSFFKRKFGSTTTGQPEDSIESIDKEVDQEDPIKDITNEDEVEKEIDQEEQHVNKPSSRPSFFKRKFGSTTTVQPEDSIESIDKELDQEEPIKDITNRPSTRSSLFKRKFGSTSTIKPDDTSDTADDGKDEVIKEVVSKQSNRPSFSRRKFGSTSTPQPEENIGEEEADEEDIILSKPVTKPVVSRPRFNGRTVALGEKSEDAIKGLNKSLYSRSRPTTSSTTTVTTEEAITDDGDTITITDEAENQTTEEVTFESIASTTTETSSLYDTTTEDIFTGETEPLSTETTDSATEAITGSVESTVSYSATRYGEQPSVNTSTLPPLSRRGNRLSFENNRYGTGNNNLVPTQEEEKSEGPRKIAATTESALSKLLKRRKFATAKTSTTLEVVDDDIEETQNETSSAVSKSTTDDIVISTTELSIEPTTGEDISTIFNDDGTTIMENIDEITTSVVTDVTDQDTTLPITTTDYTTTTAKLTTVPELNNSTEESQTTVSTSTTSRKPGRLFKPVGARPKFTGRNKLSDASTTTATTSGSTTEKAYKTNRFNRFKSKSSSIRFSPSTTERSDEDKTPIKQIKPFKPNLALYRPKNRFPQADNEGEVEEEEEEYVDEDEEIVNEDEEALVENERQLPRPGLFNRPSNKPSRPYIILKDSVKSDDDETEEYDEYEEEDGEGVQEGNKAKFDPSAIYFSSTQKPSTKPYKKFSTPTPVVAQQNLTDVNITAVNQRNRNLFNKTRKANTPYAGGIIRPNLNITILPKDTPYQINLFTTAETSTMSTSDDTTDESKTTERPTTLLHIFAETDSPGETTINYKETDDDESGNKRIEKLVEINRIITVKEQGETLDRVPKVDRLLISRVTNIKVVEDKNNTNASESHRQDRKYETQPKNDYNFNIPIVTNSDIAQINQIHIDSASSVRKNTPKPFDVVETATIPLEALFNRNQGYNSKIDLQNELLEAENSNYVHVRVLEQDSPNNIARPDQNARFIPIKVLRDQDEMTMKADVVEIPASQANQRIKIVPIAVSIQQRANP